MKKNIEEMKIKYKRDGVVFPLPALNKEEIIEAQQGYLSLCRDNSIVLEGHQRLFGHLLYPWVAKIASHPAILEKVEALIGPDILLWVSEFNAKAPNSPHYFSWHQDLYYWGYQCQKSTDNVPIVTVWLSLFNTHLENGCMRVIPCSHKQMVPHDENINEHNLLTRGQEVSVTVDEHKAVPIELAPGEFSIHHPLIHHASAPNISSQNRVGLVMRYIAPDLVPPTRPAYGWLVQGEDKLGNWDCITPLDVEKEFAAIDLRKISINSVQSFTGAQFK